MIITLIGYRGCGKTSVGPLVAERMGCRCVDSDDEIEHRAGKTIKEIFSDDGEAAFRSLESEALRDLLSTPPIVVAAGGGAILSTENRALMRAAGPVVWLKASVATLAARIGGDASSVERRPSLTGRSIEDEVAEVLERRFPLYEDAASVIVDADSATPEQIADQISAALTSHRDGDKQ